MSLAAVKTYARARMVALGYTEWRDPSFENIPQTVIDEKFHLHFGDVRGGTMNQNDLRMDVPFTVRIFEKTAVDPTTTEDNAIASADAVIYAMVKAANRLAQSGLKNVFFDSFSIEPIADSNDNGVVAKMDFRALVVLSTL